MCGIEAIGKLISTSLWTELLITPNVCCLTVILLPWGLQLHEECAYGQLKGQLTVCINESIQHSHTYMHSYATLMYNQHCTLNEAEVDIIKINY